MMIAIGSDHGGYKLKEDIVDWHPTAKAWEVFTPMFAEKYIK